MCLSGGVVHPTAAITPGRLKERRTSRICVNSSPLVTGERASEGRHAVHIASACLKACHAYALCPLKWQPTALAHAPLSSLALASHPPLGSLRV